ncbi:MAG: HNH endonuclease signature motif containing protein [Waterburya sp.]
MRSPDNPYSEGFGTTAASPPEKALSNQIWMGNAENVTWRELKEKIKAIRGAKCECCGGLGKLDLHHIIPRKNKGKDTEDNLQLLCRPCHAQTPSFGRR